MNRTVARDKLKRLAYAIGLNRPVVRISADMIEVRRPNLKTVTYYVAKGDDGGYTIYQR